MLDILWRIKNMFIWLRTFNVENFIDDMERAYNFAQTTQNYGPAVCSYYSHMGDMISQFYGKFWHFSPWKSTNRIDNLHQLFLNTLPNTPLKGVELGCGFGHTVEWMNVNSLHDVQGITLSPDEVEYATKEGLEVSIGDYHNLDDFYGQDFDFVYAIYCLKYSNNLRQVFQEINKILKPGGKFLSYEILTTENYDKNNQKHTEIMKNICRSTNMPPLHNVLDMREEAILNNFSIEEYNVEDFGDTQWYHPFFLSMGVYYILKSAILTKLITKLDDWGILPYKSSVFYKRHIVHPPVDFVEGGKMGIITGCRLFVFEKL